MISPGYSLIIDSSLKLLDNDDYIRDVETVTTGDIDTCNRLFIGENKVGLKFFHLNIRSINCNFSELVILLQGFEFLYDLIILSETWEVQNTDIFNIEGYRVYYNGSNFNKNDGVIVYSKENLKLQTQLDIFDGLTFMRLKFLFLNHTISLLALCRPPSFDNNLFLERLEHYLSTCEDSNINLIVGDINLDLLSPNNFVQIYTNIMHSHGYISLITVPTRICQTTKTCIDHIFLKSKKTTNISVTPVVLESCITDHYSTLLHIEFAEDSNSNKTNTYNKFNKVNLEGLKRDLDLETWAIVYQSDNVDISFRTFLDIFKKHVADHSSTIQAKGTIKKLKPWITVDLINAIKHRDKLKKRLLKYPSQQLEIEYKECRNKITRAIERQKFNYYNTKLIEAGKDAKQIWDVIKNAMGVKKLRNHDFSLIYNNDLIENDHDVAQVFNNFFINAGQSIISQITPGNNDGVCLPINKIKNSIFLSPIDYNELNNIIISLKNNSSPGGDGIKSSLLKEIRHYIIHPLVHIINLCFQTGKFPDDLKNSNVTPIYKNGDKQITNNYRPISVTSQLSKVIEKALATRLNVHFEHNKIISNRQFGFRKHRSTEDALFTCLNSIYSSVDKNKKTLAIFLDLAKAFDTVSHQNLLDKLQSYGIRGLPFKLLQSFITGRKQCVKINNITSPSAIISTGVPQGTVLGPILFNIYVNQLLECEVGGDIVAYADDTAIIFSADDWQSVKNIAEVGLGKVKKWLDTNS